MSVDDRHASAWEEASHLAAGRLMGRREVGLWLSDDGALVKFEDGGNVSPEVTIWTTIAGPVGKALYLDPTWRDFEGLADHLLAGIDNDGRSILLAFEQLAEAGRRFTRQQARRILAGKAERARKFLTENEGEIAQLVEEALSGDLTPKPHPAGAKIAYAHGRPVGYLQTEHVYMASDKPGGTATHRQQEGLVKFDETRPPQVVDLPIVDPFEEEDEPKPKGPLRLLRNAAGKLVGIGREGEHLA